MALPKCRNDLAFFIVRENLGISKTGMQKWGPYFPEDAMPPENFEANLQAFMALLTGGNDGAPVNLGMFGMDEDLEEEEDDVDSDDVD